MLGLPLLTAASSLRDPTEVATAGKGNGPPGPGDSAAIGCSAYWLEHCLAQASNAYNRCRDSPGVCLSRYQSSVADCQARRACPPGRTCLLDARESSGSRPPAGPNEFGTCCEPGRVPCLNVCVDPCPAPRRFDQWCNCRCQGDSTGCEPPFVWDEASCSCGCTPEPCIGGVISPVNCRCQCPDSQLLCHGRCIDMRSDRRNCGACDRECQPGENCCDGVCTRVCTDQNCAGCGDTVPAGHLCCGCRDADVSSDPNNCGACGQACDPNVHLGCQGGRCRCRPGLTQCDFQSPVPQCFDFFSLPTATPGWLAWRAAHPTDPWGFCGACNTAAGIVNLPALDGTARCCPPGSIRVGADGLCHAD